HGPRLYDRAARRPHDAPALDRDPAAGRLEDAADGAGMGAVHGPAQEDTVVLRDDVLEVEHPVRPGREPGDDVALQTIGAVDLAVGHVTDEVLGRVFVDVVVVALDPDLFELPANHLAIGRSLRVHGYPSSPAPLIRPAACEVWPKTCRSTRTPAAWTRRSMRHA